MCRTGYVPFIRDWRRQLLRDVRGFVLEVGAGRGPNLTHYPLGARVLATDFDAAAIGQARSRSNAHTGLASADIEHLAFPDETFDAVVATLVFCSVERPVVGLREVRRVLKPGGRLHLIEHVRSPHRWLGRLQDKLNPRWYAWAEGCHLNRDTEAHVRTGGFEIESVLANYLGLIKTMVARKP
ncbi:demethylmenaquinone methyltransferase / 2-methoxy-6-polyprenyl-1,4-benzoquinol methylase [Thermoflexales bacterium]|nr:demethylmenaquinone methyltransferase / 2-methoxy-6-polyprenyl-1,4-benzoquinol methylase [Thermoflexales bacterium]